MRRERGAIRALLTPLRAAVGVDVCGPLLETLAVLVQQHYVKEKHVLYPLSDDLLADGARALIETLATEPGSIEELFLDVSPFPPPKPLESVMRAILSLWPGKRLRLRVPANPTPYTDSYPSAGFAISQRLCLRRARRSAKFG